MTWSTIALIVAFGISASPASGTDKVLPPDVPLNLEVLPGHRPFLIARAEGTQNYICLATTSSIGWSFLGPQATLFDDEGGQILTHFLGANPSENGTPRAAWQHSRDTSAVWAVAIASSTDANYVAPGAVPWLLLRVVGSQYGPGYGDRMMRTTFIQRVNTSGGVAPATGCSLPTDVGKRALVPYTTDYVFYR
jgi:hypothetical protein